MTDLMVYKMKTIGDYAIQPGVNYPVNNGKDDFTLWRITADNDGDRIEVWADWDSCIAVLPPDFPGYALRHLLHAYRQGFEWGEIRGRGQVQYQIKKALGIT